MQKNFKGAKQGTRTMKGTYFSKKEIQSNYQMFLNTYMQKDKEGNWIRNDSMWNKDKDGNYSTPKTSDQLKGN